MKILFLLLLLSAPVFGQAPVEPVKVTLATPEETAIDREFCRHVRAELNKLKRVAIVSQGANFNVHLAAAPITEGQNRTVVGYAAAVLVIDPKTMRFKLLVLTGPEMSGMARRLAEKLNREFFTKR